jgi:uncharacterized RDD family membrane protein YckC
MNSIVLKRGLAFFIDWFIILIYAGLLFGIVTFFQNNSGQQFIQSSPIKGQLIGFLILTIPVLIYFVLHEYSAKQATTGKRILGLKVVNIQNEKASFKEVLLRNVLKFAPWEIAHVGVHWIVFYTNQNMDPPHWVMVVLIVPQVMVLIYFVSIFLNKENRTLYELISGTKVISVEN